MEGTKPEIVRADVFIMVTTSIRACAFRNNFWAFKVELLMMPVPDVLALMDVSATKPGRALEHNHWRAPMVPRIMLTHVWEL